MQVDNNLFHLLESRQLLEIECVRQSAKRRRLEDFFPIRESLAKIEGLAATQTRSAFTLYREAKKSQTLRTTSHAIVCFQNSIGFD
jgi:DNA-binding FadR family transcriptional regulator